MSALKRKQHVGKKDSESAIKRRKTETSSSRPAENDTAQPKAKEASSKSLLSKDQPAFPRGGGGPLTLLEKKQIRAQASRDAAREVETSDLFGVNTKPTVDSGDSDLDLADTDQTKTFVEKKTKRKRSKSRGDITSKETTAIESVSYKRLTAGSLLLGRISHITSQDLVIALPNNLTGFVPLTSISKPFSSKLEQTLRQNSENTDEDTDNEQDEESNTDLHNHFSIGQALRVVVESTGDELDGKRETKRRINLSIEPSSVNINLSRKVLTSGITVQVAVVSVEDHGAIVDMGLQDRTPAFVPVSALPKGIQLSTLEVGSVLLCTVMADASKGKAVQLTTELSSKAPAKTAPSVEAYLPGTLIEILLTQVTQEGLAGKLLGLVDVTADFLHSKAFLEKDSFASKYQVGQKIQGRLIATFPLSEHKRLAFSIIDEVLDVHSAIENRLALSSVIGRAQVMCVVHGLGVYFSLPSGALGFSHISRLSDKNVDTLSEISGPFKLGTEHQARVLEYNAIDELYFLSLQQSVLEQPFLRFEDVEIGTVIKGTVEKVLIGEAGVRGLLVKISHGITGHVSALHLADVTLKNPEKKFREGVSVKTRVLSVDADKRRIDLTLKKTLVNSDQPVWSTYKDLEVGQSTVGTLIKVDANGAIVKFYGSVKGRLPVSEMSEAFVKDAREHFKIGQVLTVHILKVDREAKRLTLTARDPSMITENDTRSLKPGSLASGVVFEKSSDDVMLRLEPGGIIARLTVNHLSDGSEKKRKSALEKIRVGQKMDDVLVLEIKGRQVVLSNKSSLKTAAQDGKLLQSFEQLAENTVVTGYISNITENRVFVRFAQGITGVINKAHIPADQTELPDFGLQVLQAVSARVVHIDFKGATPRFWLSMKAPSEAQSTLAVAPIQESEKDLIDPVDESITSYSDLSVGAVVKARITSVKDTQINVELARGIQGRVDVSEVFDSIEDIHDRKRPLKQFSAKQTVTVKILGQHDSRSYKFLPLSHRNSKNVVFELSSRPSVISGKASTVLKLEDMKVGDQYPVFVNNVADHSLMVNVSPAVRGRIRAADVSDDMNMAANLPRNFPVGSVLKARVLSVDTEKNRLDLSAKTGITSKILSIDDVSVGDVVAGRITKSTDRSVVVQLSESLVGVVELVDMADDFDLADSTKFHKNDVVRAYVLQVDKPNKKIYLSLRPSKVLSSSLEIKDPEVTLQQLNINDIRRGFVVNVSDKGLFITLARNLTAFVRVTNLSDEYLKEWKDNFQKDQLLRGKIIAVDKSSGHIQMSLKQSHIDGNYRPPISFGDLQVGDVVEGKVAKVETFGVFIVVNNSENVRGLCHRSEIAEQRIEDVTQLGFSEGDMVKAKVLKVEVEQRRVNFGMKASYFIQTPDSNNPSEAESEASISTGDGQSESDDAGVLLEDESDEEETTSDEFDDISSGLDTETAKVSASSIASKGLSAGAFDWFGIPSKNNEVMKRAAEISEDEEHSLQPKKKRKRPEILVDRTGDLDKDGPQSVDDFERLLLSEPDNAQLWIQFMAFYMDLGDIDAAREVAEKALKSIGLAQETEKQTIWIALLNLENAFGDDESVEATLQRSCQTTDPEDMHSKLASIYIHSGKTEKADNLFQTMTRKFTQNPKLWVNYATFLFDKVEDPARARSLLPRALQALPTFTHFDVTSKFAQLEFKTKTGVPEEGRTRFQGLVNLYPKRLDLFNVMLDLEMKLGEADQVRGIFEQVLSRDLKPAKAKPFFQRWLAFEKKEGDQRRIEEVEARAMKWVQQHHKS